MTPEAFVRARIVALSTAAASRVYMLKLPQQGTFPAVRVQRIGNVQGQHLRGPEAINVTRVQVDSYAKDSYEDAEELAADIKGDGLGSAATGLWGWIGITGSPAISVKNVELVHDGTPIYEDEELRLVRVRQDYVVHWVDA